MVVDRVDFLAFMCRAINMTATHKSRTAQIKEVVKAAKDILGISEVTVEVIHRMLNRMANDQDNT